MALVQSQQITGSGSGGFPGRCCFWRLVLAEAACRLHPSARSSRGSFTFGPLRIRMTPHLRSEPGRRRWEGFHPRSLRRGGRGTLRLRSGQALGQSAVWLMDRRQAVFGESVFRVPRKAPGLKPMAYGPQFRGLKGPFSLRKLQIWIRQALPSGVGWRTCLP